MSKTTFLITGGTGSFGHSMARQLLHTDVDEIRIFSRDEAKQESMRIEFNDARLKFYIGDVRDRSSVDAAMCGANEVFHAAALKQVPSCEFFPIEAVRTNVIGSSNVVESAISCGVASVVCLSTDKAVYPINAMGMTKGLMEKIAHSAARRLDSNSTTVSCVRYGNVMYSRGSVIPLFIKQIRNKQPITITESSMTRFMLPLAEAVKLVDFALENAEQGDIFVRKAPSCTIGDLATALIGLFGTDTQISNIGMRHGEKLYETLCSSEEMRHAQDMGEYFRLPMDGRDLNYAKFVTQGEPGNEMVDDYHSHNTERLNVSEVKTLLLEIPEVAEQIQMHKAGQ